MYWKKYAIPLTQLALYAPTQAFDRNFYKYMILEVQNENLKNDILSI